jgi:uronate dehydrogenase
MDTNLRGTHHLFETARLEGCPRMVFASSKHVTGFHPVGEPVEPADDRRPDGFYGLI